MSGAGWDLTAARIVVAGVPRGGKTTLAERLAIVPQVIRHTDELIGRLDWSAASLEVSRWFDEPGPWIIEGVATPRALRKWLDANPGKPADVVIWCGRERVELNPGQARMAKGCGTVFREIRLRLEARGVEIREAEEIEKASAPTG